MQFEVLGEVHVRRDGAEVRLRPKERHLLARLLVHPARPVGNDALLDELWGAEASPHVQGGSLRVHLSHLRSALRDAPDGPSRLLTSPHGYLVSVQPFELDAGALAAAAVRARGLAATEPGEAAASVESALDLWRGEPFAGIDSPLVSQHREYLVGLHRELTHLYAELVLGNVAADGHARLQALAAAYPTSERVASAQAVVEHRLGDQPRALATVRLFRERLREEFGLDATGALAELEQRLLRTPPALAVPSVGTPAPDRDRARNPRRRLVEDVATRLASGVRVLVHGPRGFGRTTVLRGLQQPGDLYLAARDHPRALQPVEALLTQLRGERSPGPAEEVRLEASQPHGATVVAARLATELATAGRRLLVDDADLLDPDSAEVLRLALAQPGCDDLPVALTAAAVAPSIDLLADSDQVDAVGLEELRVEECTVLLVDAGCIAPADDLAELGEELLAASGGHPVVAAAMARHLARTGELRGVPTSAVAWVGRVRSGLPDRVRAVLDLLVCDGPDFDVAAVSGVLGAAPDRLAAALEVLLAAGLVQYVDQHPRIAPGVLAPLLANLDTPEQQLLHQRLVEALRRGTPDWVRLARHVRAAGPLVDPLEAARLLAGAGAEALRTGATRSAVELLDDALDRATGLPPEEWLGWRLDRVRAAFRLGEVDLGIDLAVDTARLAERSGQAEVHLRAAVLSASPLLLDEQGLAARQVLERLLRARAGAGLAPPADAVEALLRCRLLDPGHGGRLAEETLAGPETGEPMALLARRHAGVLAGRPARERLAWSLAAADASRRGDPHQLLSAMRVSVSDAVEAWDPALDGILDDYEATARTCRDTFAEWNALFHRATLAAYRGDLDLAAELGEREQALRPQLDADIVTTADTARLFGELLRGQEWEALAVGLRHVADVPPVYRPVLAIGAELADRHLGHRADLDRIRTAAGALGPSTLQLTGWALLLAWLRLDDGPADALDGDRLRQACLTHVEPHRGGVVVIDGGWGIVGPVEELLDPQRTAPARERG